MNNRSGSVFSGQVTTKTGSAGSGTVTALIYELLKAGKGIDLSDLGGWVASLRNLAAVAITARAAVQLVANFDQSGDRWARMYLNVSDINQLASGGSYVVIYDADIELSDAPLIKVEVVATDPADADPELVEAARLAILKGASTVLSQTGRGAFVRVHRLVVHPTDFHPNHFARCTAVELRRAFARMT